MEAVLLIISKSLPDMDFLQTHLSRSLIADGFQPPFELSMLTARSLEEGEQLLFEQSPSLMLIDAEIEGALEYSNSLKSDEMFRFLPILIFENRGTAVSPEAFGASRADALYSGDLTDGNLFGTAYPLIRNKLLIDDMQKKLMKLQDDSIRNFILLDLVKRYIPKTVWDMACRFAEEQTIVLPETEEEVTIVYGDILGFTAISQYLKPKDVISMLNQAYELVTRITYEYEGDIDKFIGDAFLSVFTDPRSAILSALAIQYSLESLNAERVGKKLSPILFRIGVHTGPVIRGNVGGELRNDNTLIGDAVNTSARLESITPPGEVLVSEQACGRAGITVPDRYKVESRVKGKDEMVVSYNLFRYSCDNGRKLDIL